MSEQREIMEHCRSIHNALDRLKWNSLDVDRCERVKALQGAIKAFMGDVDRIPPVSRGLRPVVK